MVDTARTLAALQALLADNVAGDISPQDLRDFLVSCALITGTGELGGTAAAPTVNATHSGSTHVATLLDAKGDLIGASAADTPARVPASTDGYKLEWRASATPGVQGVKDYVPLVFIIDGGGATITTGQKGHIPLLENLTIEGWTILADQSGSIVVDVWMDTYANFPPTVADTIAGTEKPTLSTAQKNQDVSLSSFDTTLDGGSVLAFNVDSVTAVQRVSILLHCYRR